MSAVPSLIAAGPQAYDGPMSPGIRPPESDGALARRILGQPAGEAREAEEELCRRFGPRVRLFGLRHLRDEHAADDLSQHVLWLTLEKLRAGEVREPDRIDSFILGTARRAAQDFRRAAARAERPRAFPAAEPVESFVPPARLQECLHRLSERERTVLVLSFYSGHKSGDVARALAISEIHVRVIRHRAIGHLRDCLGKEARP